MESVAREQLVDAAARRIGMDPLELRRRNVIRPDDLPYRTATGQVYDTVSAFEVLEQAAAAVGYDDFRSAQKEIANGGRLTGIGLSLYVEPSGIAPPGPLATEGVLIRVEPAGGVTLFTGAANCGNSIETTLAQIVADRLGCDIEDVMVVQGDSAATPVGNGMGGSRNAPIFGSATWEAAGRLHDRIVAVASHHLEASPDDVITEGGTAYVRGTPSRRVSFADLARVAYHSSSLPDGMDLGLEVLFRFGSPVPFTWSTACHVAVCEVDQETGEVDLTRFLVSEDCGTLINPMVVDGQIAGGVVQGVGGALYEHMVYNGDGNPLTASFMDYLLPTSAEVPFIECHHLETPSTQPGGFRGMGEGGAIGSPPAVANAVADALGGPDPAAVSFPFRPCDVLARLDEARSGMRL